MAETFSCALDVAPLHAEPKARGAGDASASRGAAAVGEQRDGWTRMTTAYGYPGWIARGALDRARGRLAAEPARGGDPVEEARATSARRTCGAG